MIEFANYGRVGQGLLVYRRAMQQFIAEKLRRRQRGGAGDWFRDQALSALPDYQRDQLESKLRRTQEDEGAHAPEQLLDETHFPHVIDRRWDAFRTSLGKRAKTKRRLKDISQWRNEWAHSSDDWPDDQTDMILERCQEVVQRFDSAAAEQLEVLRTREPTTEDEEIWESVLEFVRTRETNANRLREAFEECQRVLDAEEVFQALERNTSAQSLGETWGEFHRKVANTQQVLESTWIGSEASDEHFSDIWGAVYSILLQESIPDLFRAAFDTGHFHHLHLEPASGDGETDRFVFEVSEPGVWFNVGIEICVQDSPKNYDSGQLSRSAYRALFEAFRQYRNAVDALEQLERVTRPFPEQDEVLQEVRSLQLEVVPDLLRAMFDADYPPLGVDESSIGGSGGTIKISMSEQDIGFDLELDFQLHDPPEPATVDGSPAT